MEVQAILEVLICSPAFTSWPWLCVLCVSFITRWSKTSNKALLNVRHVQVCVTRHETELEETLAASAESLLTVS